MMCIFLSSVDMLKSISIDWVILGHSERRELYGDSDDVIPQVLKSAFKWNADILF